MRVIDHLQRVYFGRLLLEQSATKLSFSESIFLKARGPTHIMCICGLTRIFIVHIRALIFFEEKQLAEYLISYLLEMSISARYCIFFNYSQEFLKEFQVNYGSNEMGNQYGNQRGTILTLDFMTIAEFAEVTCHVIAYDSRIKEAV